MEIFVALGLGAIVLIAGIFYSIFVNRAFKEKKKK